MTSLAPESTYLQVNLIGLCVTLLAYLCFGKFRKIMGLSGTLLMLLSPVSLLHQGSYWNPVRLKGAGWGIEDIIFCFSVGSLVWLMGTMPLSARIRLHLSAALFLRRFCGAGILGVFVFLPLYFSGLDVMSATIITQAAVSAALLYKRRFLWRLGTWAGFNYTLYYAGMVSLFFHIFPRFASFWDGSQIWKVYFLSIPLQEIAWVATFSFCWSVMLGYACDVRPTALPARRLPEEELRRP